MQVEMEGGARRHSALTANRFCRLTGSRCESTSGFGTKPPLDERMIFFISLIKCSENAAGVFSVSVF